MKHAAKAKAPKANVKHALWITIYTLDSPVAQKLTVRTAKAKDAEARIEGNSTEDKSG